MYVHLCKGQRRSDSKVDRNQNTKRMDDLNLMNPQMIVIPKSNKAKNRLVNLMNSDPIITVEQETPTQFFCASSNQRNFFWVNKTNDSHWNIMPLEQ